MPRRLKKSELGRFRELLLEQRRIIVADLNHLEDGALRGARDNSATQDISNFADLGSDYFEQEISIGRIEDFEKTLREIDAALLRVEDGTFGVCVTCGGPIGKARLEYLPRAGLCIQCQRKLEEEEARAQ